MTAHPRYVPGFALTLDGRPAPPALRTLITAVRFEEALEGANRVEVTLAVPDPGLLDHPLLDLDVRLGLALGHHPSPLTSVFAGTTTGVEPAFPPTGLPELLLSAHDATSRLSAGSRERGFPHYLTDSAVAALVAAENGLLKTPDPESAALTGAAALLTRRPRFQHKESDYDFLRRIAAEYGFDLWVDGDFLNLRMSRPRLPAPELELRWGSSLLEFSPRAGTIGQVARVQVRVWVEQLKTQFSVEAGWDGERLRTRVRPVLLLDRDSAPSGPAQVSVGLPDVPLDSPYEAIRYAVGELRRRLNSRVTASGSTLGDPRFRVGRTLAVRGVGRRFSGDGYRLTGVTHTLDTRGYRTSFRARQEVV
ncbi:phage late control D family protein [Streptomyces sp. NPDC004111]|uniref:phage late control D family protein n=1 Tax=Streptomyces sp. NPDC004111 TaxID=3364690 RepID=UPI0036BF8A6F